MGAGVEYGIFTGDDGGADDPLNPYNFGINARGGYTLGMGLYVGGVLDYFLGDSQEETIPGFGVAPAQTLEVSVNVLQFGAEVGYDVGASDGFVVRPKVGVGYASVTGEVTAGGMTTSSDASGIAITPGVQGLLDLDSLFLSFDARFNILTVEAENTDPLTGMTVTSDADSGGFIIGAGAGAAF